MSPDNSHPLSDISSGLFLRLQMSLEELENKKILRGGEGHEGIHEGKESFESTRRRSEDAEGYRWRGRRTLGEINSARAYLAAAPCWLSAEHAVLRKKPLAQALRHSMSFPIAESSCLGVYFGLFRSAFSPASPSSCVARDRPGQHRGRTEPCGECCAEWMNAAETERLAPLPLAQTLPRRPVGRPQLP